MKRILMFALALLMAASAGAQTPARRGVVMPQAELPRECRERDADPEKCVIKDGPPPAPIVRKKPPPLPPVAPKPPAKPEPSPPRIAPRP